MMRWLALLLVMFFTSSSRADSYVIGIEHINYYPHYDFSQQRQTSTLFTLTIRYGSNIKSQGSRKRLASRSFSL